VTIPRTRRTRVSYAPQDGSYPRCTSTAAPLVSGGATAKNLSGKAKSRDKEPTLLEPLNAKQPERLQRADRQVSRAVGAYNGSPSE
jgi:hypothetical protein